MWKKLIVFALLTVMAFSETITEDVVKDLVTLTQNVAFYVNSENLNTLRFTEQSQKEFVEYYKKVVFSPWKQNTPYTSYVQMINLCTEYTSNGWYGENKKLRDKKEQLVFYKLCGLDSYPNIKRKAITLRNTSLRLLPTQKPQFYDFSKPGEGYPFDMLQNTGIPINTPLFVCHLSQDGQWVFVESSYASGWMLYHDLAYVSEEFIENWKNFSFYTPLADGAVLFDNNGLPREVANIGSILPRVNERMFIISDILDFLFSPSKLKRKLVNAVASDSNKQAYLVNYRINEDTIETWPVQGSLRNIAKIADNMMNQTYGWGDLYGNRDCASTLMDLFAAFGRWLPRNGNYQARAGKYFGLKNFDDQTKVEKLQKEALPLGTLLWFKGHIMLYIGTATDGTPLIFHNVWGIRTIDSQQKEGRIIIGKTVITTLEPGKGREDVKISWLSRLAGMIIL